MTSIRFHGRGGQGVVTSAEVLAVAAKMDKKYAQALPAFGPERSMAPVTSFCRIDEKPIIVYQQIYHPDVVVVLDPTLIGVVDFTKGLKPDGEVILNSGHKASCPIGNVTCIDAESIAMKNIGKPFVNMAMLGALAKITKVVSLDSLKEAIGERFGKGNPNVKAAEECYNVCERGR
ncbi:MAG: 2-oxoacid:acceptor oxidoreductase family protein [Candidatus Micrarchaeia archaeon]